MPHFFPFNSATYKSRPRRGEKRLFFRALCISAPFSPRNSPKSSVFQALAVENVPGAPQHQAWHCTQASRTRFVFPQGFAPAKTWRKFTHCHMRLREILQIPTKSRFTKVFWVFSTVFVDNFVENAPTSWLASWDKVYKTQNIDKSGKNLPFKNQQLTNTMRGKHWQLPVISAVKIFVHKSLLLK
ncbi:hypothetical protein [Pseudoduganella violaceinigra]|uniref:hypothetical protein n=1 Tax=Pseudoduganella violaceinigra TaxID=246602 RepID=UPI0012B5D198|nr:hypothetical protein [Pseudoduganella violaceinigra]